MRHSLHPDPAVPFRTSCNDCELDRIFCVYWLLLPRLELVFWKKHIARRVGPPGSQSQRCGAVRCRRGHAARANILAFFFLSFFLFRVFFYLPATLDEPTTGEISCSARLFSSTQRPCALGLAPAPCPAIIIPNHPSRHQSGSA